VLVCRLSDLLSARCKYKKLHLCLFSDSFLVLSLSLSLPSDSDSSRSLCDIFTTTVRCDRDTRYTSFATWCFLTRISLNIHRSAKCIMYSQFVNFWPWDFEAEGKERVTGTETVIADWRTQRNRYPALATSPAD